MHPHVLAVSLLAFLPFGEAEAEFSRAKARHEREWDAKANKMENGVVHYFAGPQEELWLIRSER